MFLVYLDDFGHVGPYFDANHPRFNTSPVFGFAGFALPEEEVRAFSSFFIQLKQFVCKHDLASCGLPPHRWEKKGTNLFTKKSIAKYRSVREAGFRLFTEIKQRHGFVFYYGREKVRNAENLRPVGLQTTVLGHSLRRLDDAFTQSGYRFALVMDQSSSRIELLTTASKSMFGNRPCRQLVSPPFEVESHLDQNMQCADWLATIIGRVWAYRIDGEGFADQEPYHRYYGSRLAQISHRSTVERSAELRPHRIRSTLISTRTTTVIETVKEETVTIADEPHAATKHST